MIKYLLNNLLLSFSNRYGYDVDYMQHILQTNLSAFIKFSLIQGMASHRQGIPKEPYFAAKIRAALYDDCGPCTQLVVNMALEAGVSPDTVLMIVNNDLHCLAEETALVVRFTDLVLEHNPEAKDLRDEIVNHWGDNGLITLGLTISSCRVYPALKYTLGYGQACHRIAVEEESVVPQRAFTLGVK